MGHFAGNISGREMLKSAVGAFANEICPRNDKSRNVFGAEIRRTQGGYGEYRRKLEQRRVEEATASFVFFAVAELFLGGLVAVGVQNVRENGLENNGPNAFVTVLFLLSMVGLANFYCQK